MQRTPSPPFSLPRSQRPVKLWPIVVPSLRLHVAFRFGRWILAMGADTKANWLPFWSWGGPLFAVAVLASFSLPSVANSSGTWQIAAIVSLGIAVFAAVHHAEVLALRVGEPFGSLLLAVAITVIEVGLIISFLFLRTRRALNSSHATRSIQPS